MYFTGKENVAVEVAGKNQNKAVEGYAKRLPKGKRKNSREKESRNKHTGQVEKYPVPERSNNGRE